MTTVKDSLIDLERHRVLLEDSIKQIRNALQHWQTWDAEYEALKEELSLVGSSPEELQHIQDNFEADLLNHKEIKEIFGFPSHKPKDQIINILDRRIDYVAESIASLQKQLVAAENKYAAASVLSQPDAQDEEGQPITEIVEELDEDDNVISYKLNRPGETLPHVQEALKKAGIQDLLPSENEKDTEKPLSTESQVNPQPKTPSSVPAADLQGKEAVEGTKTEPRKPLKKTVSFSEDAKPAAEEEPPVSRAAQRVGNIMSTAKDQEHIMEQTPIIPSDESPEDAALRQEMLRYGMGEVGAVVAELEVEEGLTDNDEDDYDFEYSDAEWDDEDEDGDEDKYGRSTNRIVTDDYRQRMLELEQKLGVKSRFTAKMEAEAGDDKTTAEDDDSDSEDKSQGIGRIVVQREEKPSSDPAPAPAPTKSNISTGEPSGKPKKKGVRFAESLDIAPEEPPKASSTTVPIKEAVVEPLSDIVVERSGPTKATEAKSTRKPSRFKRTRNDNDAVNDVPAGPLDMPVSFIDQDRPLAPDGPEGKTIADRLVERETPSNTAMSEDDMSDLTLHQEIATEHQRLRRKFINQQGGFLQQDESPDGIADETEGGVRERPSRFKAARLSKQ